MRLRPSARTGPCAWAATPTAQASRKSPACSQPGRHSCSIRPRPLRLPTAHARSASAHGCSGCTELSWPGSPRKRSMHAACARQKLERLRAQGRRDSFCPDARVCARMLRCAAIRASAARLRTRSRRLTIVLCPSTQDCLDDSTEVCVGQPRWLNAVSWNQKTSSGDVVMARGLGLGVRKEKKV